MWQTKCTIDGVKAVLPFQQSLRKLKQSLFGFAPMTSKYEHYIEEALAQVELLGSVSGSAVLEIGSGWEPLFPLVYRLAGAKKVYLTDLYPLLSNKSLIVTTDFVRGKLSMIKQRLGREVSLPVLTDDLKTNLDLLGFEYLAPCDCRKLPFQDSSVDVVCSHDCFEHIPPEALQAILKETRRILKPSGQTIHMIDHSDHWEHGDKSISRVNFLKYGEKAWKLICTNPQNYQNRLRHSDYLAMFESEKLKVVRADGQPNAKAIEALGSINLAPRFRKYSPTDLAIMGTTLIATK